MRYTEIAQYYDKMYSFKDYQSEVEKLTALIGVHQRSRGRLLLDVACGTGHRWLRLLHRFMPFRHGVKLTESLCPDGRQVPFRHAAVVAHQVGLGKERLRPIQRPKGSQKQDHAEQEEQGGHSPTRSSRISQL